MNNADKETLDERRAKLDAALAQKMSETEKEDNEKSLSGSADWGVAVKISSEFIAGVLAGAGIGYLIDRFAGTAPWGLIIFLLLGFCAGILNVMRATGKVAKPTNKVP